MLIRALTSFVGGPPVGSTGEMPDEAAMAHIRAGHAVSVEKLADRAPKIDFDSIPRGDEILDRVEASQAVRDSYEALKTVDLASVEYDPTVPSDGFQMISPTPPLTPPRAVNGSWHTEWDGDLG